MFIRCTVNGKFVEREVPPNWTLLRFLREGLGLTGTKEGCGEGECGACTVLLDGMPVNACLVLVGKIHGRVILTVEGLAQEGTLHPLQEAFMEMGAVQCGFCTPGLLMSAAALLQKNLSPSPDEIRRAISGNLCRCTGYQQAVEAIQLAAKRLRKG